MMSPSLDRKRFAGEVRRVMRQRGCIAARVSEQAGIDKVTLSRALGGQRVDAGVYVALALWAALDLYAFVGGLSASLEDAS